jgi:hypothetical protein
MSHRTRTGLATLAIVTLLGGLSAAGVALHADHHAAKVAAVGAGGGPSQPSGDEELEFGDD